MSVTVAVEEQASVDALFEAIAHALQQGESKKTLVKRLVRQNWAQEDATAFVDGVQEALDQYAASDEYNEELAGSYFSHMVSGFLWAAGGPQ